MEKKDRKMDIEGIECGIDNRGNRIKDSEGEERGREMGGKINRKKGMLKLCEGKKKKKVVVVRGKEVKKKKRSKLEIEKKKGIKKEIELRKRMNRRRNGLGNGWEDLK